MSSQEQGKTNEEILFDRRYARIDDQYDKIQKCLDNVELSGDVDQQVKNTQALVFNAKWRKEGFAEAAAEEGINHNESILSVLTLIATELRMMRESMA